MDFGARAPRRGEDTAPYLLMRRRRCAQTPAGCAGQMVERTASRLYNPAAAKLTHEAWRRF